MNYNIAETLLDVADTMPDKTGLVQSVGGKYSSTSFQELKAKATAYADTLASQGVGPTTRVMLMVPPSTDFICLTFGLFCLGAPVILIDPGMGYRNLLKCIGQVKPDVLIGIPKAQLFRFIFRKPFKSVKTFICAGCKLGLLGKSLPKLLKKHHPQSKLFVAQENDLAAIIFTTGSTGPPKGVQYTHGIFHAQLELIHSYYGIGPDETDQPAFPLFALFSTALGAKAVLPDMNPAKPAKVDPRKFIRSITECGVTYSFGSPAIWNVVSRYCLEKNITLPIKKILMAGAPVSGELIKRVKAIMPPDGEVHTPYGATESLPITSLDGTTILSETWDETRRGAGVCVGPPLPGITIEIMQAVDGDVTDKAEAILLPANEIGEIVVTGPVVTRAYDHNDQETAHAKMFDGDTLWHRMGDMGYLDDRGRLWFCGRKGHRVLTRNGELNTICCEGVFNVHPDVMRTALVGVGEAGSETPVLCVECYVADTNHDVIRKDLLSIAASYDLTAGVQIVLFHPAFPVDIRHNAKIFREKLKVWATDILKKEGTHA